MNDICQIQIQIQKVPPCIWKYTNMCGFSHTCVVFTKHVDRSQVFGKNHTCVVSTTHVDRSQVFGKNHTGVVFTTHMKFHVINGNSHTCVVFVKQLEWCLKTQGQRIILSMWMFQWTPKHCSFTNFVFGSETCSWFSF